MMRQEQMLLNVFIVIVITNIIVLSIFTLVDIYILMINDSSLLLESVIMRSSNRFLVRDDNVYRLIYILDIAKLLYYQYNNMGIHHYSLLWLIITSVFEIIFLP